MWILWYIWKNINEKIYKNKIGNPQKILRIAEVEGVLWAKAQLLVTEQHEVNQPVFSWQPLERTRVCYADGAWIEEDIYTGQGWFCRKIDSTKVMMRAMNLRHSLSPLLDEFEALIFGNGMHEDLPIS